MQKIYKYLVYILFLYVRLGSAAGQENDTETYALRMISQASEDSILLRWSPVDYASWRLGIKQGFVVDRYTMFINGSPNPNRKPIRLTPNPLFPISVDEWEIMSEHNDYAGIAAQAIYGEEFEVDAGDQSPAVSIFNRATEQENRFSFAMFSADYSAEVAQGMGLMFTDKNITMGEKYLYVVYFANVESLAVDTGYTYTGPDEVIPMQKPEFTQIYGGDKMITLEWRSPIGRFGYTSFEIERSDDNGKSFNQRNTSPLINTAKEGELSNLNFYLDTIAENNKKYIYRVRGINPFGQRSPYSDTISDMGKDKIGEMPIILNHEHTEGGVLLQWEFSKEAEKRIKGFQVFRSEQSNRDFSPASEILSKNIRSFVDENPLSTGYYKIIAIGKNRDQVSSFAVLVQSIDSIPPEPPVNLSATIDTTGKVFLQWSGNTEEDIYGYRIYRANSADDEFSQLTSEPAIDTFFLDQVKLKTLTRKVYYRVMAIDQRQNYSEFSEILEVTRPDVVPPVPPVIKNIQSSAKGICIDWISSTSSDVVSQKILRRQKGAQVWEEIHQITDSVKSYCDTLAQELKIYEYTLTALDESGLQSNVEQIVSGKKQVNNQKIQLSFKVNRSAHQIELTWNPVEGDGRFTLYRAVNSEGLMHFATLDAKTSTYQDKKVKPDNTYMYLLKYLDKGKLLISNEIEVKF